MSFVRWFLLTTLLLALPGLALGQPRSAEVLDREGRAHLDRRAWREARDAFLAAVKLRPREPALRHRLALAQLRLGVSLLTTGRTSAALDELRAAVDNAPEDQRGEVRRWLGLAYIRDRDFFHGAVELRLALLARPGDAQAWEALGMAHYMRDRLSAARVAWRKAAALDSVGDNARLRSWLVKLERELPVEGKLARLEATGARVLHDPTRADLARRVASLLAQAREPLGRAVGTRIRGCVTVVLYPERQFTAATGHAWAGGLFDGKIRIAAGGSIDPAALERVLKHELVHLAIHTRAVRCPTWLDEGLAQRLETDLPAGRRREALVRELAAGRLIPLANLSDGFERLARDQLERAYAQSLDFVAFLERRGGGLKPLRALIGQIGGGAELDAACQAALGAPLAQLEADWRAELAR